MSVELLVVVLMVEAFIHGSSILKCYECKSKKGGNCDEPLDVDNIKTTSCPPVANVCVTARINQTFKGINLNVTFDLTLIQNHSTLYSINKYLPLSEMSVRVTFNPL